MSIKAKPGKVSVNLSQIQSIFEPGGGVHVMGVRISQDARGIAERSVRQRTGALSRSYRNAVSPNLLGLFVTLYTVVKHGRWYEEGTAGKGLGYIFPKKGRTLKIPAGGGFVMRSERQRKDGFAHVRKVRGQRPKNTMENAMRIALKQRGLL